MIRIATIGTGDITKLFIKAFNLTGRYELSAVYSRSNETATAFAKEFNCKRTFTDLNQMAEDREIDVVYIASPNSLHYSQSKLFLENGKHVICEKPIATCKTEFVELKRLADSRGLVYVEAIMSRHSKSREILFEALSKIGNITSARIDFSQFSTRYNAFVSGEQKNIFDMSFYGGVLMDLGIYCVYAAVDMFGKPKRIIANANFGRGRVDLSGCSIFEYDNFSAILTYSKNGQSVIGSEIIGDKGTVSIGGISKYVDLSLMKDGSVSKLFDLPDTPVSMSGEASRFAEYIENFESNKAEYDEISKLTETVHECMDEIKEKANIIYG